MINWPYWSKRHKNAEYFQHSLNITFSWYNADRHKTKILSCCRTYRLNVILFLFLDRSKGQWQQALFILLFYILRLCLVGLRNFKLFSPFRDSGMHQAPIKKVKAAGLLFNDFGNIAALYLFFSHVCAAWGFSRDKIQFDSLFERENFA